MKQSAPFLFLMILPMIAACGSSGSAPGSSGPPPSIPTAPGVSGAPVQLSMDPFTDSVAQHKTAVEPSILAHGNTLVSVFQVGRIASGAADAMGWATSTDGGGSWSRGFLPGLTTSSGGTAANTTDPVVAYDEAHGIWLAESLVFPSGSSQLEINRSTDGLNWSSPIIAATGNYDKCWIACDNGSSSPDRGSCYAEFDDLGTQQIFLIRSTDGGQTWSTPQGTPDSATGIGGQIAIQPDGKVVVPFYNYNPSNPELLTTASTDGGQTWSSSTVIAAPQTTSIPTRGETDPQVAVEPGGKIDVAWYDCRFESGCASNDIVMISSTDGTSWSSVAKIGGDAVGSGINHFLPTLAANPAAAGHLVLMDDASQGSCSAGNCQIQPRISTSTDGGRSWSSPSALWPAFSTGLVATSPEGPMLGDYFSIGFVGSTAFPVFSVPVQPTQSALNQQIFTVPTGLP